MYFPDLRQGNEHETCEIKVSPLFSKVHVNPQCTPHDTVVTSDSCTFRQSENYENILIFSCKSLKFPYKMAYKTLYNFG